MEGESRATRVAFDHGPCTFCGEIFGEEMRLLEYVL